MLRDGHGLAAASRFLLAVCPGRRLCSLSRGGFQACRVGAALSHLFLALSPAWGPGPNCLGGGPALLSSAALGSWLAPGSWLTPRHNFLSSFVADFSLCWDTGDPVPAHEGHGASGQRARAVHLYKCSTFSLFSLFSGKVPIALSASLACQPLETVLSGHSWVPGTDHKCWTNLRWQDCQERWHLSLLSPQVGYCDFWTFLFRDVLRKEITSLCGFMPPKSLALVSSPVECK